MKRLQGWPREVPHPGLACCMPEYDLAGWCSRRRQSLELIRADLQRMRELRDELTELHNARTASRIIAERSRELLIEIGYLNRIEQVHAFRLNAGS